MEVNEIEFVRKYISYGGFGFFMMSAFITIVRGSFRIDYRTHCMLMSYWERIFGIVYLLCIAFVQVGTFAVKDIWSVHGGPDDAWEIIWGFTLILSSLHMIIALTTRQFYLYTIHTSLYFLHYFLVFIVANILIRDQLMLHVVPMIFCAIYGFWFFSVVPRPFQIAGHTASMTENDAESFILMHGFSRDYVVIDRSELEDMKEAVGTWKNKFLNYFRNNKR